MKGLESFDRVTNELAEKGMFNEEQFEHMRHLSSLPPERKCASGWHVKDEESCDCKPAFRFSEENQRLIETLKTKGGEALPQGKTD